MRTHAGQDHAPSLRSSNAIMSTSSIASIRSARKSKKKESRTTVSTSMSLISTMSLQRSSPSYEWDGTKYPSLVDPLHAANMVLHFAPETNGEVAYRGFKARERSRSSARGSCRDLSRQCATILPRWRSSRVAF